MITLIIIKRLFVRHSNMDRVTTRAIWSRVNAFLIIIITRGVPNCGFRLFGRIRIVLWTIRPNKNTNTNSVAGWAFWRCTCCSDIYHLLMTLCPLFFSHNQAVWEQLALTGWSPLIDVTSCTIHVQTNYLYSFWRHYSSKYEYTIRHRSEYLIHP